MLLYKIHRRLFDTDYHGMRKWGSSEVKIQCGAIFVVTKCKQQHQINISGRNTAVQYY